MKDADRAALRRRQRADKALDGLIAGPVTVLLDQILPDALDTEPGIALLRDRGAIRRRRASRPRRRAGEHFGRICGAVRTCSLGDGRIDSVRAGEHFGRICFGSVVVPAGRFATHAGLGFNSPIAPVQDQERGNLLLLRHLQVVGHRSGRGKSLKPVAASLPAVAAFQVFGRGRIWMFGNTHGSHHTQTACADMTLL